MITGCVPWKIKFTSHRALLDKFKYVLKQLYCYAVKYRREEKSHHIFPKVFLRKNYENWSIYYNGAETNSS